MSAGITSPYTARRSAGARIHCYALSVDVSNLPGTARNLDLRYFPGEIRQGTPYSCQGIRVHQLPGEGAIDSSLCFRILSCVCTASPHASPSGRNLKVKNRPSTTIRTSIRSSIPPSTPSSTLALTLSCIRETQAHHPAHDDQTNNYYENRRLEREPNH